MSVFIELSYILFVFLVCPCFLVYKLANLVLIDCHLSSFFSSVFLCSQPHAAKQDQQKRANMNIEVQGSVKRKNMQAYFGFKIKNLETLWKILLPFVSPSFLQCCSHVTLLSHLNIAEGKGASKGVSRIFDIGSSYYSKVVCHSICHFRNEKGTGTEMRRAMVSGIVSGDAGQFYISPRSKSFRLVSE